MTEFREQNLTGARAERVSLLGATFTRVFLNDASMHGSRSGRTGAVPN